MTGEVEENLLHPYTDLIRACLDVLIDNPSKSLPASREDFKGTSRQC